MNSRVNWSNIRNADGASALSAANRLLPPVVSLLLVVLIGWQIARLIWMLFPGPAAGVLVPVPSSQSLSSGPAGASADVSLIAASHMFGVADAESTGPAIIALPDEDLADTRLSNLVLKGTVASPRSEFSVALISDSNNEQKVYVIGDSLGSGTTLHSIYSDRVVLNEKGALTNLKLPREFSNQAVRNVRQATATTRRTSAAANSIQSVVSQNLTKLTDVIRPTPYMQNGKPAGYRVYPGRDRKQFAALGLRPGDIIKDIDGQSLTDPTQAMQIFQSLGTSEQVTVTVERNGQGETLVLKTSQLDLNDEQTK